MKYTEIFSRFFLLGCISFGGPGAHIGFFQKTFVTRLDWLSQQQYTKLVALSQFLPGPGSSQVGFAIGCHRAGLIGGIAAFLGFTLPSFILMILIASGTYSGIGEGSISGVIIGLKLVAVVVLADAVISMSKMFCAQWQSAAIAICSAIFLLLASSLKAQLLVLMGASVIGIIHKKNTNKSLAKPTVKPLAKRTAAIKQRFNWQAFVLFLLLFLGLPWVAQLSFELKLFSDFYQAGSLVFGGGHVVLPLLQHSVGGAMSNDQFLTGYAAAQAVPGPMFTLASYLGALMTKNTVLGALIATGAIFLPGFLLMVAFKDSWEALLERPAIAGASWGINAAVVGLLMATLYQPVFVNSVSELKSLIICALGLLVIRVFKCPVILLIAVFIGITNFLY